MDIKIIQAPSKENPFAVIYKPHGLPSAPLNEGEEENALALTLKRFPEMKVVKGRKEIEYGLLHRLDTITEGILLIASTQESLDFLMEEQKENRFVKYYKASCSYNPESSELLSGFEPFGKPMRLEENAQVQVSSYFRFYGEGNKVVRPVPLDSKSKFALKKTGNRKLYTTEVKILSISEKSIETESRITQGFRHQVRCHLSWIGLPVINDNLYNYSYRNQETGEICFKASAIEFSHPLTGKRLHFEI